MTILNVIRQPERIVVVTDTDGVLNVFDNAGGARDLGHSAIAKMFPLVHWPGFVAGRGFTLLPMAAFSTATVLAGYDDAMEGFAQMIDDAASLLAAQNPGTAETLSSAHHIVVGGWSHRLGRMDVTLFESLAGEPFRALDFGDYMLSPQPGEAPADDASVPRSLDDHIALARRQARRLRAAPGNLAGGGDLVVASIGRDGIGMELVRDFTRAPRRTMSAAFGCELGRR